MGNIVGSVGCRTVAIYTVGPVLNNARDDDQGAVRCMHNLMNGWYRLHEFEILASEISVFVLEEYY